MMLVSGPRVAVSGLRRADCCAVPALMKMNVSCSSMPVGIFEKTAKEAEDNVLLREMHNIQYPYVPHNAPHKVLAPFLAAVRRRERRLLDLEMEVSTTYRTRVLLLSDSSRSLMLCSCSGSIRRLGVTKKLKLYLLISLHFCKIKFVSAM